MMTYTTMPTNPVSILPIRKRLKKALQRNDVDGVRDALRDPGFAETLQNSDIKDLIAQRVNTPILSLLKGQDLRLHIIAEIILRGARKGDNALTERAFSMVPDDITQSPSLEYSIGLITKAIVECHPKAAPGMARALLARAKNPQSTNFLEYMRYAPNNRKRVKFLSAMLCAGWTLPVSLVPQKESSPVVRDQLEMIYVAQSTSTHAYLHMMQRERSLETLLARHWTGIFYGLDHNRFKGDATWHRLKGIIERMGAWFWVPAVFLFILACAFVSVPNPLQHTQ